MSREAALELLRRDVDPAEYDEIRELWKRHSIAEDQRDLPGLLATLTDDCVYDLIPNGARWEGHEGATRFYTELLTAFPDIHFELASIVIGPQGVYEQAHVTGTQRGAWLDRPASGERVEFETVIFFPWNPERRRFAGERIFIALEADGRA
jgi:predicted ester cyclase